jgi:2-keto-4-pentenoate hydratase
MDTAMTATRPGPTRFRPEAAARWLGEALETGNGLAPLPAEIAPRTAAQGARVAAAVLAATGQLACGLRLLRGGESVAGPMIEARLLRDRSPVAISALRHPRASAALVAVLGADLVPGERTPPEIAALHPALDIAGSRFTTLPDAAALRIADLGELGMVVAGRAAAGGGALLQGPVPVALGPAAARRPKGAETVDLAAALAEAAAAARRWGGLPAGALLVVAGLTPPVVPQPGEELAASLGPIGRARAVFA